LHEVGAEVQLVSRRKSLKFHTKPTGKPRTVWQKLRHPQSGLGPGLKSRFFANAPGAFHHLPEGLRLKLVRETLGPSGGWFAKDKVVGRVSLLLGQTVQRAEIQNGRVCLHLGAADGAEREIVTEHVIAATGYRVDLERLNFLDPGIRSNIKTVDGSPVLSTSLESSVPGLYFAGVSAANSFGPVMRFAYGAGFAARALTMAMAKAIPNESPSLSRQSVLSTTK
jgi:hypothetical protein